MITISGLTPRQAEIAQEMWQIQTMDAVRAYIKSLNYRDQLDAAVIMELIIQEGLEEQLEDDLDSHDLAQMTIEQAMRH